MLQAALAVAFFGFLRVSKFTVNSWKRKAMRRGRFLAKQDVLLAPYDLHLTIKYSKMDQLGKGSIITMGLTRSSLLSCPRHAILLKVLSCQASCSIIPHPVWQAAVRLRSTLHSLLCQNSYDPGNYNTHCLRIGAARAGLPPATIKQLGRWCSDAYSTYVRHTPNHSSTTAQIARAP